MRNAHRRRNISAIIATAAISVLIVTIATHEKDTGPGAWFGVVLVSFFTGVFSLMGLVTFHLHVRWQQQLLRGDRFLARWTVLPTEWELFRANEKPRLEAGRGNAIKVQADNARTGIDVVVAQDSLMIGDDFYKLLQIQGLQYFPETPPSLEYNMITSGKSGSVHWNIRFPVAAGAEAGARAIWDYVNREKPVRDEVRTLRRFRLWRVLGFVIGVVCLPLFVYGYLHRGQTEIQTRVLICLIGGMAGAVLGFFISALTHGLLRSAERNARKAGAAATTAMETTNPT